MRLKHATLFYLLAVVYQYAMNIIGTTFPDIYQAAWLVRTIQLLSVLTGIISVYFYAVFYLDYPTQDQPRLKEASMLAVIGTGATVILSLRGLFMVFSGLRVAAYEISPDLISTMQSGYVAAISRVIYWGSSMLILLFFYRLYRSVTLVQARLKYAALAGFMAALVHVLARTSVGLILIMVGDLRWIGDLSPILQLVLAQLVTTLVFLGGLFFLLVFYTEQSGVQVPPAKQ